MTARLWLAIATVSLAACRTPDQNTIIQRDRLPVVDGGSVALPLGAGDVLEVRVFGESDLSGVYTVLGEGSIDFPLCGRVKVAGQPVFAVSDVIARCLEHGGFVRRPRVTAELKQFNSMQVFVFGEVPKPGAFAFSVGMTIVHAVSQAGGFSKTASKNNVNITRVLDGKEVKVPVRVEDIVTGREKNFDLQAGDIIFVPESFL